MNMIFFADDPQTNAFNEWIRSYGIWIAIAVAGTVFLLVVVLFLIALIKRKRNPDAIINNEFSTTSVGTSKILEALGGLDNIKSRALNGSRIVLMLNNYDVVDEKSLNENGIDSVIKMSNKITLVCKRDSSKIYKELFH